MKASSTAVTASLFVLLTATPMPAPACGDAGTNTHAGQVLSVDKHAGTFTLLDAETMSPITLAADSALLEQLSSISGSVAVNYKNDGGTLRALKLK